MKHVILGTAGHVDHGKTALIRALTGIDTDRLAEEKRRGITIESGFAHLDFDDGLQIGIVDVPGHEKFIKNMLAGAGGIDICMLVVAANEGVMPQTIEHLNILRLLSLKDGIVVITKSDLVDPEWLELVKEDIVSHLQGTFLEGKPLLCVSSLTGAGLPELKNALHHLADNWQNKKTQIPFRLPIDRVFPVDGFGTVVTGTLIEGTVSVGDAACLQPSGKETKLRSLQVHGKDRPFAHAGQRVALNLAGIKKEDIRPGDVVSQAGSMHPSSMLDVNLELLNDSTRSVKNNSLVHFYHGTKSSTAKVILLDRDELHKGETALAQLRMTEPVAAKIGDRFIIRFFSPLETIGGGLILDSAPLKHKRFQDSVIQALSVRKSGSFENKIIQIIAEQLLSMPDPEKLAKIMNIPLPQLSAELEQLVNRGLVTEILPGRYISPSVLEDIWLKCQQLLSDYHKNNPLHPGMKISECRQKLFNRIGASESDAVLNLYIDRHRLKIRGDSVSLYEFEIRFTKQQAAIRERLLDIHRQSWPDFLSWDTVFAMFPPKEKENVKRVLESLVFSGDLITIKARTSIHKDNYYFAYTTMLKHYSLHSELTLAHFRDMLGIGRKNAMAILEYWDNKKITRMVDDARILLAKELLSAEEK